MGKIGYGYGSEWHLLRWMGRNRKAFDNAVLSVIKRAGNKIEWLDFKFKPGEMWADAELKGMEFLESEEALQENWNRFWPVTLGSKLHYTLCLIEIRGGVRKIIRILKGI